ncbi:MAG: flippase activity-associated protein Agl23, partial [Ktedonobacterales bacterium]
FASWRNWFKPPRLTVEQYLWLAVLALGAFLRFWNLGAKPVHHDESMHAYFSLTWALDPSSYWYDPLLHGPFQFHAEGLMFGIILFFQHLFVPHAVGDPWINDTTARFVPALFGLGIVALPYFLRRELGRVGALLAAFLLAVSPAFVYFSRFLREDIYFNFFMFAMVVCAVRYAHGRTMRWFVGLFAATVLAYATFEGIFLTFAIFFGFLAVLLVWELATFVARLLPSNLTGGERLFFSRAGLLVILGGIGGALAITALHFVNSLNVYIMGIPNDPSHPAHQMQSDAYVLALENRSVAVVLYASIIIALLVIATLIWQMVRDDALYSASDAMFSATPSGSESDPESDPDAGNELATAAPHLSARQRRILTFDARLQEYRLRFAGWRDRFDPAEHPFLWLLFSVSWVEWFVAFVVGWMLFAVLYWIIPGGGHASSIGEGFQIGIGRGIWQGLYYWIQQQQVARGGQPIYYYLLLLPLYEQLACVFGLAGIVYALMRPTRFRMFLVWWFLASLAIYSWAGEKMPWLSIQILLPLMLLAAIMLERVVQGCVELARRLARSEISLLRAAPLRPAASALGGVAALLLLVPMLWGMWTLSQRDAADAPHEMMVYVQTTQDVNTVMSKIRYADQKLYHGSHQIRIGVGSGMEWPFHWYLFDYPNTIWGYNAGDPKSPQVDVLLVQPVDYDQHNDAQSFAALHPTGYQQHQYSLRSWWDEGYKPPPCVPTKAKACPSSDFLLYGVGLDKYLTYGSTPPPNAHFDTGKAANRLWRWLWLREPLGDTHGSTDFVFIVRDGLPISA